MNALTKEIAQWLKISIDDAIKVQDEMGAMGADFSEMSTRSLKRMAKEAWEVLQILAKY